MESSRRARPLKKIRDPFLPVISVFPTENRVVRQSSWIAHRSAAPAESLIELPNSRTTAMVRGSFAAARIARIARVRVLPDPRPPRTDFIRASDRIQVSAHRGRTTSC